MKNELKWDTDIKASDPTNIFENKKCLQAKRHVILVHVWYTSCFCSLKEHPLNYLASFLCSRSSLEAKTSTLILKAEYAQC